MVRNGAEGRMASIPHSTDGAIALLRGSKGVTVESTTCEEKWTPWN